MALYSRWHQAEASGGTNKFVRCEKCQTEYVYAMERVGQGREISLLHLENEKAKRLAADYAGENLAEQLRSGCEPVPCPNCGWYQSHMLERAKELFWAPIWRLGLALIVIGTPLLVVALIAERYAEKRPDPQTSEIVTASGAVSLVTLIGGSVLLYIRWKKRAKYNPNDAPEAERMAIARELAITLDEFKILDTSRQAPSDSAH